MGIKLNGVWTRKPDLEFADAATVTRARALVSNHPWSIVNAAFNAAEYGALFGQDELEVLRKSAVGAHYNMVASATRKWVLGGVWVPLPPKLEELLKDGYEWQQWGTERRQVPIGTVTAHPATAVAEISAEMREQIAAIVFQSVTDALESWATKG